MKNDNDKFIYVSDSMHWLRAAILQCERLYISKNIAHEMMKVWADEKKKELQLIDNPIEHANQQKKTIDLRIRLFFKDQDYVAELYFLIMSLKKFVSSIELGMSEYPELKYIHDDLDQSISIKHIKNLRNMYEHSKEYNEGKGRNQSEYYFSGFSPETHFLKGTDIEIGGRILLSQLQKVLDPYIDTLLGLMNKNGRLR